MGKIGIITITRGENYGNMLQNYAVQKVIATLGFFPETIINTTHVKRRRNNFTQIIGKLRPQYSGRAINTKIKKKFFIKNDADFFIRSVFWAIKSREKISLAKKKRAAAFHDFFVSLINVCPRKISTGSIDYEFFDKFDYIICGSDQVWNPNYPQTSMIDFLQFIPESKRIAYAPSFGLNGIPQSKQDSYAQWIKEIPALSVREERGAEIIRKLTGRKAEVLPDPVIMLDKQDWCRIAKQPAIKTRKRYILTYFLGNMVKDYYWFIKKTAQNHSLEIINLADIHEPESYTVGPCEFLYLVDNAELVCTDSFHGTLFSIIMKRNFIVFPRVEDGCSMHSRIETLLKKFCLNDRLYSEDIDAFIFTANFKHVDDIIKEERNRTFNYLKNALKQSLQNKPSSF